MKKKKRNDALLVIIILLLIIIGAALIIYIIGNREISISAGEGIILAPNPITKTGTVSADTNYLQRRIDGDCRGEVMVGINSDGTVVCETDDLGEGGAGLTGAGTENYVALFENPTTIGSSIIYQDDSNNIGIRTTNPSKGEQSLSLDVEGAVGAKYFCDENGNNCVAGNQLIDRNKNLKIATGLVTLLSSAGGGWYCSVVDISKYQFTAAPHIMLSIADANSPNVGGNSVDACENKYEGVTTKSFKICGRTSTSVSSGWDAYPALSWLAIGV